VLVGGAPALYFVAVQTQTLESESRVIVASRPRTLVLVISPDNIEAVILGPTGAQLGTATRMARTNDARTSFAAMWSELEALGEFDRVTVTTKQNLGEGWQLDALTHELEQQCGRRVRAAALDDLRWSHLIRREGVELVIALGDELESAVFFNGALVPGLALGRHRFRKGRTYAEYLAPRVREKKGVKAWNRRLERVVDEVLVVWNPARLYVAVPPGLTVVMESRPAVVITQAPSGFERALSLWK
jgi:polyphosphate glucokinase